MPVSKIDISKYNLRALSIKLHRLDEPKLAPKSPSSKPKRDCNCDCLKDLASHPIIVGIDKKLTRILQLLEDPQEVAPPDFSSAAMLFPVSNHDELAALDEALDNEHEKKLIKGYLRQIKEAGSTNHIMDTMMKSIFDVDFIVRFTRTSKTEITDLLVIDLLNEIWCNEASATEADFLAKLYHWMRKNNQNVQTGNRKAKTAKKADYEKAVIGDQVEGEFREPEIVQEAAPPAVESPNLGKRKMAIASKPTKQIKVEAEVGEQEIEAQLSPTFRFNPPESPANAKAPTLKVANQTVAYIDNLLRTNAKDKNTLITQIKQWKGDKFNIQALDKVVKQLFCDEYLTQFRKNFSPEQNDFFNNNLVVAELRALWLAGGSTAEAFNSSMRYCVQLARSRAESKRPRDSTTDIESVYGESIF